MAEFGPGPPLPGLSAIGLPPRNVAAPMRRSIPTRITISAINVDAKVIGVGRAADGAIATPSLAHSDRAGWYEPGPSPGQRGPAVIVGHVDSYSGPAIFYDLGRLRPGDKIKVHRRDHKVATFRVYSVRDFPKRAVPRSVFTGSKRPELRVITCGGPWVGGRLGYADNIVAFASLQS